MHNIFLLFSFLSQKESTFETNKNVFNFTSKALLVLEIFKYSKCRVPNFMNSSNAKV